jgi:hypothetical protein
VAARIADAGPNRCSQVAPARSIGSKGSPSARTMRGTLPAAPWADPDTIPGATQWSYDQSRMVRPTRSP